MSEERVVIVSGGSRGLGAALCERFLRAGLRVATFSRKAGPLNDRFQGHERFHWQAVDVGDCRATRSFVLDVVRRWQRVDGLVNNAGMSMDQLLALSTDEAMERTIAINMTGALQLTRAAVRVMMAGGGGCVVNVSSILGQRGFKGTSVYAATKAGLEGFSRSLAREVGARGIRVNSIAPGFIETDMTTAMSASQREQILRRTPLGRLGRVEDVVDAVWFLLSPAASFITGQTLVVDGGLTC